MMYSPTYMEQLQSLHNDPKKKPSFGGKIKDLGEFYTFMDKWKAKSLLDYGCGKGAILTHLQSKYSDATIIGYDPAVPAYASDHNLQLVECVFSNDVLEHIEPEYINEVLTHINSLAEKYIWLRIDTWPARKFLPDGRNAHILLQSTEWWTNIINTCIDGNIVYSKLIKKGKFDVAIEK